MPTPETDHRCEHGWGHAAGRDELLWTFDGSLYCIAHAAEAIGEALASRKRLSIYELVEIRDIADALRAHAETRIKGLTLRPAGKPFISGCIAAVRSLS